MPDVEIAGSNTVLSFPDTMSPEQIKAVLDKHPTVQKLRNAARTPSTQPVRKKKQAKPSDLAPQEYDIQGRPLPRQTYAERYPAKQNTARIYPKEERDKSLIERGAEKMGEVLSVPSGAVKAAALPVMNSAREKIAKAGFGDGRRKEDIEAQKKAAALPFHQRIQALKGQDWRTLGMTPETQMRQNWRDRAGQSTGNQIVGAVGSFLGEMGTDPTTWLMGGGGAVAKKAAERIAASRGAAAGAKAAKVATGVNRTAAGAFSAQMLSTGIPALESGVFEGDPRKITEGVLSTALGALGGYHAVKSPALTADAPAAIPEPPKARPIRRGSLTRPLKKKNVSKVAPTESPQELAPTAPVKRVSQRPAVSAERMNPEDIGVLEGMQYKKAGITDSKNAVGDTLKGTDVYDVDQGGTLTVWEDATGKRFAVNGHHRRELAQRADRFVRMGPEGPVEVPREVNVNVLREVDGWTMEKARAQGALENIRDGKGTALDALEVMNSLGSGPEQYRKLGVSTSSDMTRNLTGLQALDEQSLLRVRMGDVSEQVAAGIGSVEGLTPAAQRGAIDEAARTGTGTYQRAKRLAEHYLDDQRSGRLAEEAAGDLFGGEFATASSTRGIRVKLEESARRLLKQQRSDLLKPTDAKLREGEVIDAQARKAEASSMAESQKALDERLDLLYRQESVRQTVAEMAAEVGNGKLTEQQAGRQLAALLQPHTGRSVAELADPRRVGLTDRGSVPAEPRTPEPVQPGAEPGLFAQEGQKVASEQPALIEAAPAANAGRVAGAGTEPPRGSGIDANPDIQPVGAPKARAKSTPQQAPAPVKAARTLTIGDEQAGMVQDVLGYDHPLSLRIEEAFANGKTQKASLDFTSDELLALRGAVEKAMPSAKEVGVSLASLRKQLFEKPVPAPMSRAAQAKFAKHTLIAENDRGGQVYETAGGQFLYRDADGNVTTLASKATALKKLNAGTAPPPAPKMKARKGSKPGAFQFGAAPGSPADRLNTAIRAAVPNKKQKQALTRQKPPNETGLRNIARSNLRSPLTIKNVFGEEISLPGLFETKAERSGLPEAKLSAQKVNDTMLAADRTIEQRMHDTNVAVDEIEALLKDHVGHKLNEADKKNFVQWIERDKSDPARQALTGKLKEALDKHDALTEDWRQYIIRTRRQAGIETPDDWGITEKGYFRHLFLGDVQLYEIVNGKQVQVMNPRGGFFRSYAEAQGEVNRLLQQNPNAQFVATAKNITAGDPTMRVSNGQFFRAVGKIKENVKNTSGIELSHQEIMSDLRGTLGRKAGKSKFNPVTLMRKGFAGFDQDYGKVMRITGAQVARAQELTLLQRRLQPEIERLNKLGLDGLAEDIQYTLDDLWGTPGKGEKQAGVNKARALARRVTAFHSFVKLHFNVGAAAANLLDPLATLWPRIRSKDFGALYLDYAKPSTRQRLREAGVLGGATKIDDTGGLARVAEGGWQRANLFRKASDVNRGIGYLYGEREARLRGITDKAQLHENGMAWAKVVEYASNAFHRAPMLRGPLASVLLQYKGYTLKQLETVFNMARTQPGDKRGIGKAARIGKFAVGKTAVAGGKALGALGALGVVSGLSQMFQAFGMNRQDADKWAGYGLAGQGGVDMSGKIGSFELPYGETFAEQSMNLVGGPTVGAVGTLVDTARSKKKDWRKAGERIVPLVKQGRTLYEMSRNQGRATDTKLGRLSMMESVGQALGFPPVRKSQVYDRMNAR